ncbi:MAG: 50S ribosomal protein L6 [Phycisphaerales bacterium]|nr:50S ribosomal protein L6 [Phycisphaerales bacterium]MCI0632101.1 50S ribosomal protein L6 [Phycisphaerales bacterium]MCI0676794.1 50S ribosomal protein L6 [Phycisphaerales bacterium]
MSRIGKQPISVPKGVKVNLDPKTRTINIEGPKGKLSFDYRPEVTVVWNQDENAIKVSVEEARLEEKLIRALWGTTRARIQTMIVGVTQGYSKKLEVIGVGWSAKPAGKNLQLNVGYADPVVMSPPQGVQFAIEGNAITISGPNKEAVGEFAAEVRAKRPPEPYNGKGIKYDNEVVQRKQGKVFGA